METTTTNTSSSEPKQEKILYIMRGLPGSGKSTLAHSILAIDGNKDGVVFSTDDYFILTNPEKIYKYDRTKLTAAHQWNQERALAALEKGVSPIIIDNTHSQRWEAKFYVENALAHSYSVVIREPETEWWKSRNFDLMAKKNTHGVQLEDLHRMVSKWDNDYTVDTILASKPPRFNNAPNSKGKPIGGRGNPKPNNPQPVVKDEDGFQQTGKSQQRRGSGSRQQLPQQQKSPQKSQVKNSFDLLKDEDN